MESGKWKVSVADIEDESSLEFEFDNDIKELEDCHVSALIELRSMGDYIERTRKRQAFS